MASTLAPPGAVLMLSRRAWGGRMWRRRIFGISASHRICSRRVDIRISEIVDRRILGRVEIGRRRVGVVITSVRGHHSSVAVTLGEPRTFVLDGVDVGRDDDLVVGGVEADPPWLIGVTSEQNGAHAVVVHLRLRLVELGICHAAPHAHP